MTSYSMNEKEKEEYAIKETIPLKDGEDIREIVGELRKQVSIILHDDDEIKELIYCYYDDIQP